MDPEGFEPTTACLQSNHSTIELRAHKRSFTQRGLNSHFIFLKIR